MAILLSDKIPSTNVDETGNIEIAAPSGGNLEIQDSTGTTQILLSDTGVSLAGGSLSASPTGVDANQLVTLNGGLVIVDTTDSDTPLHIKNTNGDTILKVTDTGDFVLAGSSINEVVSTINKAQDNTKQLATVAAITNFVHTEASGALAYQEFNTKAEFDTFLPQLEIQPSIVLVKDSTPFDYTDTSGDVQTGLTWWLGIVQKPVGESLSTSALFHSNSQDSLTGPEISAALYAQADTNQYTDADKAAVQTISNKMPISSSGVDFIMENPGNGHGYLLFRNAIAPVNQKDFALIPRSDGTFDFEARLDDESVANRWTYEHEGDSYFPGAIFQGVNQVLDTSATTAYVAPSTNRNYVTDSEASAIANLPANTTSALSGKLDSSLVTTNINDASGRIPEVVTVKNAISSAINGIASSQITGLINSAPDAHLMTDTEHSKVGNLPTNTNTSLSTKVDKITGKGLSTNDFTSTHKSKVDNLPTNTNSSLAGKIDTSAITTSITSTSGRLPDAPTVKSYVDSQISNTVRLTGGFVKQKVICDHDSVPQIVIQNDTDKHESFIGFGHDQSFIHAGIGYDEGTNSVDIRVGNSSNWSSIVKKFSLNRSTGHAVFENNLQVKGTLTTSNSEIRVGTNSDGTGGHPVLTPNNIGDLVASFTYMQDFPTLSQADITQWFQQMAHVQFIGVGTGTLSLPQIVGPETTPTSSQVLAGSTITLTNYNSGLNINLSRFNTGQTFMIDNVGNLTTSATLFFSSKIELQALDVRNYSNISTDWCWALRGI